MIIWWLVRFSVVNMHRQLWPDEKKKIILKIYCGKNLQICTATMQHDDVNIIEQSMCKLSLGFASRKFASIDFPFRVKSLNFAVIL